MKIALLLVITALALTLVAVATAATKAHEPGHCIPSEFHPCDPPPECDPALHPCHTAVKLVFFNVYSGVARWRTAQETDTLGFNVYYQRPGYKWIRANARLIRARGDVTGHRYVYRTGVLNNNFHWRLQAINANGTDSWFDGR